MYPQIQPCALQSQPDAIKAELESVFNKEEEGRVPNQTLRLKKVALERAYEAALKKKKASGVPLLDGFEGLHSHIRQRGLK